MHRRAEDVEGSCTVAQGGAPHAIERRPEDDCGEKKAEMLRGVDPVGLEGRLVEHGDVPHPERDGFHQPCDERRGEKADHAHCSTRCTHTPILTASRREGPQACCAGMGSGDQRGRDEDHDLVLEHVRAEELLAEFVNGRCQRKEKAKPAGDKAVCRQRSR